MDAISASLYNGCLEGYANSAKWADVATRQISKHQGLAAAESITMAFELYGKACACRERLPAPLRKEIDERGEHRIAFDATNRLRAAIAAAVKGAE